MKGTDSADTCIVCGADKHRLAYCCKRCKKLIDRVDIRRKPDKEARIKALKRAWDGQRFHCYYTGVALIEDDHRSPLYLTFDHRTPRNEKDIVLAAQLINDMKSDMSENEFKAVVRQLANYFESGKFDPRVLMLEHWKR